MKKSLLNLPAANCIPKANERARLSNQMARNARTLRGEFYTFRATKNAWQIIMEDAPALLYTILFITSGIVEIVISWPMYGELQSGILAVPNPFLSAFIGFTVVTTGAVVSHLIGKRLSPALMRLEEYNLTAKSKSPMPLTVVEEVVHNKMKKQFLLGLLLGALLFVGVIMISLQRVGYMNLISGQNFGWFQKLLPVIIVFLEIYGGIYFVYFSKRLILNRKIDGRKKAFDKTKNDCAYNTEVCKEYYDYAIANGYIGTISLEIHMALYRFGNRALDADNYVDEIPMQKHVDVLLLQDGLIVKGKHLFGQVTPQNFTNAEFTNDQGKAVLIWLADEEFLNGINIGDRYFRGPFCNSTNVVIDLGIEDMLERAG